MRLIWIATFIFVLSACSESASTNQQTPQTADSVVVPQDTVPNIVEKPIETAPEPVVIRDGKSFKSAQEAYDEGYYNGHQEGYTDATHHLEYGYYYDDEPEYSGFLQAYIDGYEEGYNDGYNEGQEWNSEND